MGTNSGQNIDLGKTCFKPFNLYKFTGFANLRQALNNAIEEKYKVLILYL